MGLSQSQSDFCTVIRETLTLRAHDPDRGAMARDIRDIGKERPEVRNISRREVLGLIGATAAASLVVGPGEEYATAEQTQSTSGRIVRIDAKPEAIAIDIKKTAVIVVDMQNDFGTKGGAIDLAGIDISGIRKVIAPIRNVLTSARHAGIKIVYLKMAFRPDLSDFGAPDSPNRLKHLPLNVGKSIRAPDGREGRILIRDTWNTDIVDELKPQADDFVIYKHRYSGFYQTDLHSTLKKLGIQYLLITGCTTSVCVESTVRDAMFRDYSCVLLEDCMSQPTPPRGLPGSNHEASLVLAAFSFGWVSKSEQFMTVLQVQPIASA
jgi:ureidoacrylate peracid hydrolase